MYSPSAAAGSIALVMRVDVAAVVEEDLHLLLAQGLLPVDGQDDARAPAVVQQRALDARRVDRVAVAQQDALANASRASHSE